MILLNLDMLLNEPLEFEWGHAFAAHKCGDDTAKNLGRMTLNPLKHIDPVGFIMILLVGFGWAKPVPVNSRNYYNYKRGEAIVSLAGVAMNLLLAILFSIVFVPMFRMYIFKSYSWLENGILIRILSYGVSLNLVLMLFNLIPVYPLDGYHLFELAFAKRLPIRVFLFLRRYGTYILIAVLLLFRLLDFHPISMLSSFVLQKLMNLALHI